MKKEYVERDKYKSRQYLASIIYFTDTTKRFLLDCVASSESLSKKSERVERKKKKKKRVVYQGEGLSMQCSAYVYIYIPKRHK